jgi:hypothetical protein
VAPATADLMAKWLAGMPTTSPLRAAGHRQAGAGARHEPAHVAATGQPQWALQADGAFRRSRNAGEMA